MEILNVAVHPAWRGRGIGAELLRRALQEARKRHIVQCCLEVRRSNAAARALYAGAGFAETGLRRGYYADTGEDAIVMTLAPAASETTCPGGASSAGSWERDRMQTIIAANWKMNKTRAQAEAVASEIAASLKADPAGDRKVIIFPPATALNCVSRLSLGTYETGIQNIYPAENGAFTGEIAPCMVHDAGGSWVLAGHSERRHIFNESDEFVARKVNFALAHDLKVMLCVGETLEEREAGQLRTILLRQLTSGLSGQGAASSADIVVAYEPVWAIGTGRTAGSAEIEDAHGTIRDIVRAVFPRGDSMPILYGGSVKPSNAGQILALDNVNGLLVGGASLEAGSFLDIVRA